MRSEVINIGVDDFVGRIQQDRHSSDDPRQPGASILLKQMAQLDSTLARVADVEVVTSTGVGSGQQTAQRIIQVKAPFDVEL